MYYPAVYLCHQVAIGFSEIWKYFTSSCRCSLEVSKMCPIVTDNITSTSRGDLLAYNN